VTNAHLCRVVAIVVSALVFGNAPSATAARRALALTGESAYGSSANCFSWDTSGSSAGIALSRTAANCQGGYVPFYFSIPLQLDTSGTKTVALTLKVPTAGVISCSLAEQDLAGSRVELVDYDPFPAGSGYITRSETISVAANNHVYVLCAYMQSNPAVEAVRLLSISY